VTAGFLFDSSYRLLLGRELG